MTAYYNEVDPYCIRWLENLMRAGHIPKGHVDDRSIEDVKPDDLSGYDQCHFFAGIGGWPLAARLAGWDDDRPLWTGSCPCQPFSAAGKRAGFADERHLWPAWFWLIRHCRPAAIAGEQVASKAGRLWLAGVRADLEAMGYAVGAADLCAAGVGAPHIRQRLWWVGHAGGAGSRRDARTVPRAQAQGGGEREESWREPDEPFATGADGRMEQPHGEGRSSRGLHLRPGRSLEAEVLEPWAGAEWIECADRKARRIEPGTEPLVDGFPGRVGQVRAYGNGIVPQVAAEVIRAGLIE